MSIPMHPHRHKSQKSKETRRRERLDREAIKRAKLPRSYREPIEPDGFWMRVFWRLRNFFSSKS